LSTIEELLERKRNGFGLGSHRDKTPVHGANESREYTFISLLEPPPGLMQRPPTVRGLQPAVCSGTRCQAVLGTRHLDVSKRHSDDCRNTHLAASDNERVGLTAVRGCGLSVEGNC
jgi:hypothetical protein